MNPENWPSGIKLEDLRPTVGHRGLWHVQREDFPGTTRTVVEVCRRGNIDWLAENKVAEVMLGDSDLSIIAAGGKLVVKHSNGVFHVSVWLAECWIEVEDRSEIDVNFGTLVAPDWSWVLSRGARDQGNPECFLRGYRMFNRPMAGPWIDDRRCWPTGTWAVVDAAARVSPRGWWVSGPGSDGAFGAGRCDDREESMRRADEALRDADALSWRLAASSRRTCLLAAARYQRPGCQPVAPGPPQGATR
jgi:hypothetical protein